MRKASNACGAARDQLVTEEVASNHSRAKIKQLVQEHLAGSAGQKPKGSTATRVKTFKFRDDPVKTVQAAIDRAKKIAGTEDDSAALEIICNSWRILPKVSGRKFPFPRLLFATCPPRPISNGPRGFEPRQLTRFGWMVPLLAGGSFLTPAPAPGVRARATDPARPSAGRRDA
jgi:hypothetical protein